MKDKPDVSRLNSDSRPGGSESFILQKAFMLAPVAMAVAAGPGLKLVHVNKCFMRLAGARRESELTGQEAGSVLARMFGPGTAQRLTAGITQPTPYQEIEVPLLSDGERYFNLTAQPLPEVSTLVCVYEITQLRAARMAGEEQLQRMRAVADVIPHKIFVASPAGEIRYLSVQWEEYTGYEVGQLMSDTEKVAALLHPDDLAKARRVWARSFRRGNAFEMDFRIKDVNGEYRWHMMRARPVGGPDGEIDMWVGSTTDIDDFRRAVQDRRELEIKAGMLMEQSQQLMELNQAKDEFISLASHQLRTPATGVKQYIGMLLEGYGGDVAPGQVELLQVAYESNERQLRIIDDLLKVAHVDAGKVALHPEATDIGALINDVVKEQSDTFHKRDQQVKFSPPRQPLVADIDPARVRMVLENLIDNAGKYSPHGRDVSVRLVNQLSEVRIAIVDQGVGIAEADVDKLFQKFSRVNNPLSAEVGGSGIGLYWAKRIIDMHHGTISVDSKQGEGSTFTINLPKESRA